MTEHDSTQIIDDGKKQPIRIKERRIAYINRAMVAEILKEHLRQEGWAIPNEGHGVTRFLKLANNGFGGAEIEVEQPETLRVKPHARTMSKLADSSQTVI